ncbi:MAG: response regulator [Deltaproteobacteria bacterium]|nr:response regulator [Deltaproteobacteria bacterium]
MGDESEIREEFVRAMGQQPEPFVEATIANTGQHVLDWLVTHLGQMLEVHEVFVGEISGADWDRVHMLALAVDGAKAEVMDYDLRGTPCCAVVQKQEVCIHRSDVARLFPEDELLAQTGAQSYAGVPLVDTAGRPLGLLAVMHTQAFTPEQAERVATTLEFWRPRVHAELRMRRAEQDLLRVVSVPAPTGTPTLASLCTSLSHAMNVRAVFVAEREIRDGDFVTKAFSIDGEAALPARLAKSAEICAQLTTDASVVCDQEPLRQLLRSGLSASLPFSPEGFLGLRLRGSASRCHAYLGLVHDRSIALGMATSPVLRSFAQRLRGELARQHLEEERMQMERELLQASTRESLGTLASGIAHDFNNLLVNILGNTELLRAELPPGTAHDYADEAHRAAEQAALLCRRILDYASHGSRGSEPVDLARLTHDVAQLTCSGQPVAADIQLDPSSEIMVDGDPAGLSHLIMNLVKNALEAAAMTQGAVRVSVRSEQLDRPRIRAADVGAERAPGLYACVNIEDEGPGMDQDTRSHIFDAFYTTKPGGHGLGLAALEEITERHRAVLMLRTEPGEGTCFTLAVPLSEARRAQATRSTPVPARGVDRGRALVVDDQDMVARVAKRMLERLGFEVVVASDGESALVETESRDFELALIDLSMPGMPGDTLAIELRRRFPKLPIVLSSGFSDAADLPDEARTCIDAVLPKPYGYADIVGVVERAVTSNETSSVP